MSGPFERYSDADVAALIADYPLAWVIGDAVDPAAVCQLPMIGEYDAAGRLVSLIGHMARRNPLHAHCTANPRALFLFSGPNGYISPQHADRRDWAPTWNFAHLRIAAAVAFDEALTDAALDALIDAEEGGRARPWRAAELGARRDKLAAMIIGFRAGVESVHGRFKLGQDEQPETFRAIVTHHPDPELRSWMGRFAARRNDGGEPK